MVLLLPLLAAQHYQQQRRWRTGFGKWCAFGRWQSHWKRWGGSFRYLISIAIHRPLEKWIMTNMERRYPQSLTTTMQAAKSYACACAASRQWHGAAGSHREG